MPVRIQTTVVVQEQTVTVLIQDRKQITARITVAEIPELKGLIIIQDRILREIGHIITVVRVQAAVDHPEVVQVQVTAAVLVHQEVLIQAEVVPAVRVRAAVLQVLLVREGDRQLKY